MYQIEHEGSDPVSDLTREEALEMAQSVADEFNTQVSEREILWGTEFVNAIYVGDQLFAVEIS